MADGTVAPQFEKLGPFIYNVTTHNDLLEWNEDNGTMTYSSYDVFEWCEECTYEEWSVSGDNQMVQRNILKHAENIGHLDRNRNAEQFAKAGFTKSMMTTTT